MNRSFLASKLRALERHSATASRLVKQQRAVVRRLEDSGRDATLARELLAHMEQLEAMCADWQRVVGDRLLVLTIRSWWMH